MRKKELKSLEAVRKALKKEIDRVDAFEANVRKMKRPHAFALGYLDVLQERRLSLRQDLDRAKTAISDLQRNVTRDPGA